MDRRNLIKVSSLGAISSITSPSFYSNCFLNDPMNSTIEPFKINFKRERIDDLLSRLKMVKWPNVPFQTGWNAGTNHEVLIDLVNYWLNDYDWFKIQKQLNNLNHFHISIDTEKLHFVHYKNIQKTRKIPLLLIHGWPSSFLEFIHGANLLEEEGTDNLGFNIVIPSLPGFVFSDAPGNPGMHVGKVAD